MRLKKSFAKIILLALTAVLLIFLGKTEAEAAEGLLDPEFFDFTTDTETEYAAPRGTIVNAGTLPFKLYDNGTAKQNKNGLYVENGYLTIQKDNPTYDMKGFVLELCYSSAVEEVEKDGVLLMLSTKAYGSTQAYSEKTAAVSILVNGDIYIFGQLAASDNDETTGLTAGFTNVGKDMVCRLYLRYISGKLTVSFDNGVNSKDLLKDYECELAALRQFVIGSDKNTKSRLHNITYKGITVTEYGTYVAKNSATKAVVQIGTDCFEYLNISDAWQIMKKNAADYRPARFELYADWNIGSPLMIPASYDITLDLRGHIIDRGMQGRMSSSGSVAVVEKNAKFHVVDSLPDTVHEGWGIKGGILTGGGGDDISSGVVLKEGAVFTMNGGNIANCVTNYEGGAVCASGDSVNVTLENAGFYGNMTLDSFDNCHGGAIYMDGDSSFLTVRNCIFEGNYSEDNGGAIYMNDGRLKVYGTAFYDNSCVDDGGAIYYETGSNSDMEECIFLSNHADGEGGAVYCNSGEETKLSGVFRNNYAKGSGGAIYVNGGTVALVDAVITNNSTSNKGGGVYVDEMYDLNVQGVVIVDENVNSKKARDNVYLDSLAMVEAHIYVGGLYDGSEIWVKTAGSNHDVCETISEYQMRFIKSDDSRVKFFKPNESQTRQEQLISSVVSEGQVPTIIIGCVLVIGLTVAAFIIIRKRRKGGKKA